MIGKTLKELRKSKQLGLKEVQAITKIDKSILSKIENEERIPTQNILNKLVSLYECDEDILNTSWLSEKILNNISDQPNGYKALEFAEKQMIYGDINLKISDLDHNEKIKIESRRYIGNKAKLVDWIFSIIKHETKNVNSFFDVFAGTGVVANRALKQFDKVYVNDILHSNNHIYNAFFLDQEWDKNKISEYISRYNNILADNIKDNYFSLNFGNKFFDHDTAKKIGYIREDIEKNKEKLSPKEFSILLTTLIYNIDKVANTVGHFDAYFKKDIRKKPLSIKPIDIKEYKGAKIHKEDSNTLAKDIKADIAYIDPPYNSRQYSRFYHVYETLVKWDKPELYGVALKPKPENMSKYCTVKARDTFADLVQNLNSKYIIVSYNNTYKSKSKSSENKIKLEEIKDILEQKGHTKIFECSHKYFNTGKTDFNDHKELLFVTKSYEK